MTGRRQFRVLCLRAGTLAWLVLLCVSASAQKTEERYFVMGDIAKPGAYPLAAATTVSQAVQRAGGTEPAECDSTVKVIRVLNGEKQTKEVTLADSVLADDVLVVICQQKP